jgi:hypothetical protein
MILSTTTLPYDGGVWMPSFSHTSGSQWTEILIDTELENTKWGTSDQITSLSDLTPSEAKPIPIRSGQEIDEDDDLFSELDDLSDKTKTRTTRRRTPLSSSSQPKITTRRSASPAAAIPNENIATWEDPSGQESSTSDELVKPSEILKEKRTRTHRSTSTIPQPSSATPRKKSVKLMQDSEKTLSSAVSQIEEDIKNWKEPSAKETSDESELVKPSGIEKSKDKKSTIPSPKKKSSKDRPPPPPPDD